MNKCQREKSLHIKFIQRTSKQPMTYKEAKRKLRRRERKSKKAAEFCMAVRKQLEKEIGINALF